MTGQRWMGDVMVVALLAVGFAGGAAARDKADDWPEITQAEKEFATVPGDTGAAAVLLRHTRDGKMVTRGRWMTNVLEYHWRLKVLTDRGKDEGAVEIPAYKWSRVDHIRARTIKPDGTIVTVTGDQIFEKLVAKGRGVRETAFVFNFPAVEPGAILEYAYERETTSLLFVEPWYFSDDVYTVLSRVSQAVPTEAHYKTLCDRCPNPEPDTTDWKEGKVRGKLSTIEMRDVPANRREILMPTDRETLPRFEMILKGWVYAHWDALGRDDLLFTDWNSVARYFDYYYRKAYLLDEVAMEQVVASWTAGLTEPDAKIRAIFSHVQRDFRYEGGSYVIARTRSIADINKSASADNEEKAVLLVGALRALGLEPMMALVSGMDKGPVYANYYSFLQFSHVVVVVSRQDGQRLWLDPTATWTPFGVLSWRDAGAPALLIHGDGTGELVKLPQEEAASGTRYVATVTPRRDGRADIEAVVDMSGDDAADMRGVLAPESESARRADVESWVGDRISGATLKDFTIADLDAIDKPLKITLRLEAPGLVMQGDEATVVHGCALDCFTSNPIQSGERTHPIYIDRPMQRESEVTILAPEGSLAAPPPPAITLESIFGTYKIACVASAAGGFLCRRSLTMPRSRWPNTSGPALRKLFEQITQADRAAVSFNPAPTPSP